MRFLLPLLFAGLGSARVAREVPEPYSVRAREVPEPYAEWADLKPLNVFRKPLGVWSEEMDDFEEKSWSSSSGSSGGTGGSGGSGGSGGTVPGTGDGTCGKASSTRVVGGERAEIQQYPWMAFLIFTGAGKSWTCGGSLISKRWVLTAAHCTSGASSVQVNMGGTLNSSPTQSQTATGSNLITHQDYNAQTVANDIAVIKLPKDVTINDKVRTVCMPRKSVHGSTSFAGVKAQVSGWGRFSDSSNSGSSFLRHATVPIMSNSQCQRTWPVPANQLCIDTTGGKSSCNGDSGGPLVVKQSDGTFLEVGVVSYGSRAGCEKGIAAVFARVTEFLDWISQKTGINLS